MKTLTSEKLDFWAAELEYIQSIDPNAPGAAFNNDRQCFESYCQMQGNSAHREGLERVARAIYSHANETE